MSDNETSRLIKGAVWLSIAGLISKIFSALYRVILQNLTGDIGFYIYQQVYPLLGIAMMLALYGFPSAISSLTAMEIGQGRPLSWRRFYGPVLLILGIFHAVLLIIIYLSAPVLAMLAGDAAFTVLYQLTSVVFLIIPVLALLRGVQQGRYEMAPTAFSQIGEQILRVGTIILGAWLVSQGIYSLGSVGTTAVFASLIGGAGALGVLLFFHFQNRFASMAVGETNPSDNAILWKTYLKTLLLFGIAAAMNHMTLLLMQLADAFTFVPKLVESGITEWTAKEMKGVFDRGQPLIQVVTVVGSSIALAIIPALSHQNLKAHKEQVMDYIRTAMYVGIVIAVGAVIGLIVIFPEVNQLLFKNMQGTGELRLLMLTVVMSTLSIIGASILQSFGYIVRTALFIGAAFIIKVAGNLALISVYGVYGASMATVLSLGVLLLLVMLELYRKLPAMKLFRSIAWKSLSLASLAMTVYLLFIKWIWLEPFIHSRILLLVYVLFISMTGAVVFLYVFLRTGGLTETQIHLLPKSKYLLRIYKGRNKT